MRICILPPAIFKHVFDANNFSIISNLFDSYKPYALSTHNQKCTNKMHHFNYKNKSPNNLKHLNVRDVSI